MTTNETIETAAYFQPVSGICLIDLPFAKKHAGTEITAKTINAHTTTDRVCDKPAVHTQRASEGMSERRNMSSRRVSAVSMRHDIRYIAVSKPDITAAPSSG